MQRVMANKTHFMDNVKKMKLDQGYYYAVSTVPQTGNQRQALDKYFDIAERHDISQVTPKPFDTHIILKHYGNYIATYNTDIGVRDTIQRSDLIAVNNFIKKLRKIHTGSDIMNILDELDSKGKLDTGTPAILNLTYEDIDKDQYFIALEYVPTRVEGLIMPDIVERQREVKRTCAIVSKAELDHYKERYPEITTRRVGI